MSHRKFTVTVVLAAAVFTLFPSISFAQEKHAHHWGYSGAEGPEHWGDLEPEYATCKTGRQQAPIDIRNAKKSDLPAIEFDYHPAPLHIINNGHSIQVNYPPGSFITIGDKRYQLTQFHFHRPSEETIEGKHFEMVLHLVHADAGGKLAVVSVLLNTGAGNAMIDTLWAHAPQHAGPEEKFDSIQVNPADLLPSARGYYSFPGSLTTPPCSEGVTFFVLKTPLSISKEQAAAFARLYEHNARPIQPLNDRVVLESK